MKKLKIGKSDIHGKGLFSGEPIRKGDLIAKVHSGIQLDPETVKYMPTQYGRFYNHDEKKFNTKNEVIGNHRYLRALKNIPANTELTANYREHSDMEQPENFGQGKYASFDFDKTIATDEGLAKARQMLKDGYNLFIVSARDKVTPDMVARARKAGIPEENIIATGSDEAKVRKVKQLGVEKHFDDKPDVIAALGLVGEQFKKGGSLNSKKYTKSITGTNKLFTKNNLFKKKSTKRIYDPNAKYFDNGGINKLEGDLISKVLMERNRGVDFVDRAFALGDNPGTPMFNLPDDEQFGQNMSHKMAWGEDDNGQAWMYPTIMNPNDEAIQVPNQYADYISSEGYKNATGMNQYAEGGESGCPPGQYWNGKKCTKLISYATDKKLIDGVSNWAMQSSNPDKISSEYNDQIKHYLYSGKYGYDPVSMSLIPLSTINKKLISEPDQETKKILAKQDDKAAYTQSIIDAGFDPETFGKSKGTNVITGEQIYGDKSQEDIDKINKEAVNNFVTEGHRKAILESPFNTAAFFTPAGMAVGVMQGAANLLPDVYDFAKDPSWSGAGAIGMDALMMSPAAKGIGKVLGYKGVPKELPGSPNTVDNVQKAGFLNPLALLDRVTPRLPAITKVLGMEDDVVNHSPFNLIPGYGKKLAEPGFTHPINSGNTEITAYRKFGNSLDDLKNSKTFRPQGGFRMGANQIKTEGNWAEAGIANENYKGVFAAGMNPRVEGTNIQLQNWSRRNGVVGMTKQGNPAIPITDPGLEFHRRLPFSNRYVPIDKQKLIDNKFE